MSAAKLDSAPLLTRFHKPALLLLTGVLLLGVHFSQRHLNRMRDTMGLTRVTPLENAPPILAFTTVALGGFRGLIANMLWLRVSDMQEQEKYFEMVQLADWITKLQPHIATVWQHLAWNMSYNISVKFSDPNDRWIWVQRGIRLLRDEGGLAPGRGRDQRSGGHISPCSQVLGERRLNSPDQPGDGRPVRWV